MFNQPNKFDQQCLRLLMDFQWQTAGNTQTLKLQEELVQVKKHFQKQQQMTVENRELQEQLALQKVQLQDQDRTIRRLERELNQVKQ